MQHPPNKLVILSVGARSFTARAAVEGPRNTPSRNELNPFLTTRPVSAPSRRNAPNPYPPSHLRDVPFLMEKGGYTYILGSLSGTLYIGVTSAIYPRVLQHRNGTRSGFAHTYACTRLLYVETFPTIDEAITREKQLKGWKRSKKLALIHRANPEFKDMAAHWGWQMIHRDQSIESYDQREKLSLPITSDRTTISLASPPANHPKTATNN